jgi:hypothetical protein
VIAGKPERELSRFSTAAQSELFYTDSENDPAQIEKIPGAFKLPAPQRPCGIRAYKTLAGVFSISGLHLVQLVLSLRVVRIALRSQNVERYRRLLERVTEESDRQQIINLLAEERQKQKDAGDPAF